MKDVPITSRSSSAVKKCMFRPGLGAGEVAKGEATVAVALEAVVVDVDVDVAVCGVDSDAEQPSGRDAVSRSSHMLMDLLGQVVDDAASNTMIRPSVWSPVRVSGALEVLGFWRAPGCRSC